MDVQFFRRSDGWIVVTINKYFTVEFNETQDALDFLHSLREGS